MNLAELVDVQKNFDEKHQGRFDWSQRISEDNIYLLEHLLVAYIGEIGEFANIVKKVSRGDLSLDEAKALMQDELADIFIYLIKISYQLDIDLEICFKNKVKKNKKRFKNYEK